MAEDVLETTKRNLEHSTGTFVNDRNETLWYQKYIPEKTDLRGILVFLHGILEHSSRYNELFTLLASEGFAVYTFDIIGHGRSEGDRGYFNHFGDVVDDIDLFLKLAKAQVHETHPRVNKLILMGLSFGGLLTNLTVLRKTHAIDAIVLCAPGLNVPRTLVLNVQAYFASILSEWIPKWEIVPAVQVSDLSAEAEVLAEREKDPLVYKGLIRARVGNETLLAFNYLDAHKKDIHLPVLIVLGTLEKVVCTYSINHYHRDISSVDKELKIFDAMGHSLLSEANRGAVFSHIVSWLHARFEPIG
ncbi:unnamed protein product [Aphanomyces euteiches]|uniref:Serine aminopeptidase S33 domain-containing protein n=1 Tax=Aphanomyces euteiches TaxID=100861 RepID=A0A6G0WUK2_9STRA|nr:hypothetical protein Ae201684_011682 [Aphanomyces euteiches]KAH9156556.1 hypothetical protein AeRB84_001544 [Aphanomyces euteiches]